MIRRRIFLIGAVVVALGAGMAYGQAAKTGSGKASAASVRVPADGKDLMVLAAKVNGLAGLEDRAWHVKAKYQIYDPDGLPEQTGVFEEWWAGPRKYKVRYAGGGFKQTLYVNGTTWSVSGSKKWPPQQVEMAKNFLLRPLPPADFVGKLGYEARNRKLDQTTLWCVYPGAVPAALAKEAQAIPRPAGGGGAVPTTCFDAGTAAVRMEQTNEGLVTVFNQVEDTGGHYVARSVTVQDGVTPIVTLEVTKLEFPARIADREFRAPANGVTAPVLPVESNVLTGLRLGGRDIPYPAEAKAEGVTGLVIVGVVIDRKGSVADVKVIAGPKLLRDAVASAVKTWKYKPYLLNGKPVKIETQINVVFAAGG